MVSASRHIYTHTGQLELLVVNPYEAQPGLYDEVAMRTYRDAAADAAEPPPHSFALVARHAQSGRLDSATADHHTLL